MGSTRLPYPTQAAPAQAGPARGRDAHTVLVADDDPFARHLVATILRGAGYRVVEAGDGEAALQALEAADVDLVLTDLDMPRMGGAELARRLAARRPELKVLVVSGGAPDDAPGLEFEPKPVRAGPLLRRVRALLRGDPARPFDGPPGPCPCAACALRRLGCAGGARGRTS